MASTVLSQRVRLRPRRRPPTLLRRLFAVHALLLTVAVAVLALAPVTVSVPVAITELAGLLAGLVVLLAVYRVLLERTLGPLEHLTDLMQRVDPLRPGQRIAVAAREREVASLAQAFNDMLDRLEDERRESARRALLAQEAERRRIARELHDEIGQVLTGLVLRSETLARRLPAEFAPDVVELREAARAGAEDVRAIAQRLRPAALDELGLPSALVALSGRVADRAGFDVRRELDPDVELSAEQELVIYRVAQEGLTNVARHAAAQHVELALRRSGGGARLELRDDGVGLPDGAGRTSTGLLGMHERALLIGARLTVRRAGERGTELILEVPARG